MIDNIPLHVVRWASQEVQRQDDQPADVYGMCMAWAYAADMFEHISPDETHAQTIAFFVKPRDNSFGYRNNNYRRVTVLVGYDAPPNPSEVPGAMQRLWQNMPQERSVSCTGHGVSISLVDEFVIALLKIHPWIDGNGRTASIIWNWMNGTLMDPRPLPDFFKGVQ